jgi:hypothetical protein
MGIKFLISYSSLGSNSKHIFYYYDLVTNLQAVNVFQKSHFLNLITEAEIENLPDPTTTILWIEHIQSIDQKKVVEGSTKTHFTTAEDNEPPMNGSSQRNVTDDKNKMPPANFTNLRAFLDRNKYSSNINDKMEAKIRNRSKY